jgi:hypothetical protein
MVKRFKAGGRFGQTSESISIRRGDRGLRSLQVFEVWILPSGAFLRTR